MYLIVELRAILVSNPILRSYKKDASAKLHTNATKYGCGAILLRRDSDNLLRPVYYANSRTPPAEGKCSSYEFEVLTIVKSLKKFRVHLIGILFKIVTNCKVFSLTVN